MSTKECDAGTTQDEKLHQQLLLICATRLYSSAKREALQLRSHAM